MRSVGEQTGRAGQVVTGPIREELFIKGESYSWEDWLVYSTDEEKIIVFDPRNCTSCQQIVIDPLLFNASSGPVTIDIYTQVSYDIGSGTALVASNRRETLQSTNPPEALLRLNPTGFTGTKFAGDLIPSTGPTPLVGAGNQNQDGSAFEIDKTIVKAIGLKNRNGDGVYIGHKLTWYEIRSSL
jgi:hypothetical protein